jgi:hypothetical protein
LAIGKEITAAMPCKKSIQSFRAAAVRTLILIILTVGACIVLQSAYPYGMLWADTVGYLEHGFLFQLFETNIHDWRHMPLFSFLLRISVTFSDPPALIFWIQATLFGAVILMLRKIASRILGSDRAGFLCALAILLWEIALMNTFFFTVNLVADTPYMLLLLLGSLMAIDGWWDRSPARLTVGLGFIGLAAITKPAALSILPLWGLFALWSAWQLPIRKRWAAAFLAALILPLALWSMRTAVLYGTARPNAFLSRNILARVLPLVREGDRLLPTPADDEQFITRIRTFERQVGTDYNDYMSFGMVQGLESPMYFLRKFMPGDRRPSAPDFPYRFDAFGIDVALRIIGLHPWEYAMMVFKDYVMLFRPWVKPHPDPHQYSNARSYYFVRQTEKFAPRWELTILYPPEGLVDPDASNSVADKLLQLSNPLRKTLMRKPIALAFVLLAHVLACASTWMLLRSGRKVFRERGPTLLLTVCTLLLFGNAFFNYLLAALVEEPLERYQLSAAMGLNILYAIWILVAFERVAAAMPWRKSNPR